MGEERIRWSFLFLSLFLPTIIAFHLFSVYQTTAPSLDGLSHLYISKNVIHNGPNSGIKNLGTIWLPLYHIALLPFVAFDFLYFSGFAGTLLGIISLFFATFFLLRFLSFPENAFAATFFIFHPYLLLFSISPMTEVLTIFLLIFTAYYFDQFFQTGKNPWFPIIGVILGTLTRYEFYPIAFFIFPLFFWRLKKEGKNPLFSFLLFFGIFLWLFWNQVIFSDPLFFYHHPVARGVLGRIAYAGSLVKVWRFNWAVLQELFGYLPVFSLLGIFSLIGRKRFSLLFSLLILLAPLVTHFFLAYSNISLGYARFFLLSFPGLILSAFAFFHELRETTFGKRFFSILFFFLITLTYLPNLVTTYQVLSQGRNHYQVRVNLPDLDINYPAVNFYLKTFRHFFAGLDLVERRLLIPFNQEFQAISFALKLRPESLFDAYDGSIIKEVMVSPWQFCHYILFPESPSLFCQTFQRYYGDKYFVSSFFEKEEYHQEILFRFSLIREGGELKLYQRK